MRPPGPSGIRQRGSGVFGTAFGLLVFLVLMLTSVQVLYALYSRSMVTNAAYDAARYVAGFDQIAQRYEAIDVATERFRDRLGPTGETAVLDWQVDADDMVVLRVRAEGPSVLPEMFTNAFGVGGTNREVRVRVEREQ